MEQRLMILGSMDEFIELVNKAKKRGIYTVVCDGYPDGPAKKYADKAYDIDIRKVDEIVEVDVYKRQVYGPLLYQHLWRRLSGPGAGGHPGLWRKGV